MHDQSTLRRKARQAIEAGKLPDRFPDRTWGGPGVGDCCSICSRPVEPDDLELEIEFVRSVGRDRHHVHIRCFAALEFELRNLKLSGEAISSNEPGQRTTVSRRVLPETLERRKMDGRGHEKNHRRGSG